MKLYLLLHVIFAMMFFSRGLLLHRAVRRNHFRLFASGEDTVVSRCTKKITDALRPLHLKVSAAHDDPNGSHIAIECVSAMFEGKSMVMRQRLVYKAIWDEMSDGGAVHAVDSIIAKTPDES